MRAPWWTGEIPADAGIWFGGSLVRSLKAQWSLGFSPAHDPALYLEIHTFFCYYLHGELTVSLPDLPPAFSHAEHKCVHMDVLLFSHVHSGLQLTDQVPAYEVCVFVHVCVCVFKVEDFVTGYLSSFFRSCLFSLNAWSRSTPNERERELSSYLACLTQNI